MKYLLPLTHSCLEISTSSVNWSYDTFDNNFGINHYSAYYLKEICNFSPDQSFSFKYFLKITLVGEIYSKMSGLTQKISREASQQNTFILTQNMLCITYVSHLSRDKLRPRRGKGRVCTTRPQSSY